MKLFQSSSPKNQPAKQVVIELYSSKTENTNALRHEVTSNSEIGKMLRQHSGQSQRFIYASNEQTLSALATQDIVNLADEKDFAIFWAQLKANDSLTIVVQGNVTDETIAHLSADDFVALLQDKWRLPVLSNIELFAGNMGLCEQFRKTVCTSLHCTETFTTYSAIPTANKEGKFFVIYADDESEEGDRFLSENELDNTIRIVEPVAGTKLVLQ